MGFLWLLMVVADVTRCTEQESSGYTTVDNVKLATDVYGTDLLHLENRYRESQSYRFEDFFWTGSGDGPPDDNVWTTEPPATIYKTSTIVSTVFIKISDSFHNETTTPKCVFNCESPHTPNGEITPSPTQTEGDSSEASQQFWIVTILKSDGRNPIVTNLTNSLAKLYKTAFDRQQERHLGITHRLKRSSPSDKPVNVFIHKVDRQKFNGDDRIEVLYHVEVLGKPVDAVTASNDMNFVSDDEVSQALGYPFIVKAEPYLKAGEPMGLAKAKNTWIFIGFSLLGLLVLLLVLAFLILGFTKRKRVQQPQNPATDNRRHVFERGVGHENKGLVRDDEKRGGDSPTYVNYGDKHEVAVEVRARSSFSSSSSSSLDISPLMTLGKKHRVPPKKPPRPKAALNKTVPLNVTAVRKLPPEVFDSDSGSSRKDSPDTAFTEYDVLSPKSYLSMPSVKSFPRCSIPEPLAKVLEPVSMTHLDMPDDEPVGVLERHGSVGTAHDPGVIGPVVWNLHCERLQHGVSVDEGINDLKSGNVSRMRKRFHDLLDDTFSLFGSKRDTPVSGLSRPPIEVKSHSANENREGEQHAIKPRPKTTDPRKPDPSAVGPRGAWSSTAPSPLVRPLSAGVVYAPRVNVDHVLAEGRFRPSDPAIPLIEAIKSEIERVSLPGSTTNLDKQ
ncbi:uncharacterized protein LOC132705394 [Cylas formicarius]|uniref:uncharacterized protein LOC132705394 n=1 Tax=Cylas formicarius TaxID=197179 RepID=UPI002958B9A5|nr:uncharacterized protein LOC132705394 [Cylas formicarius]